MPCEAGWWEQHDGGIDKSKQTDTPWPSGCASTDWVAGNVGPMAALDVVNTWPVGSVAAAWLDVHGNSSTVGAVDTRFRLASVTKPLFALAVLVAVEEGSLSLDQPAGPEGATVAHLLSHSSGLAPEAGNPGGPSFAPVGTRRIYSNQGFEILGAALADATEMDPATYFHQAVVEPLGLPTLSLEGSPAHGALGSVADLALVAGELLRPTLIHPSTLDLATSPHLPSLDGVLPGFGRQSPNPWGLGFEIRGTKSPHWTGAGNSPATFGHFGAAGTFLWIDPDAGLACAVLTDREFGPWAAELWPSFSDDIIGEAQGADEE